MAGGDVDVHPVSTEWNLHLETLIPGSPQEGNQFLLDTRQWAVGCDLSTLSPGLSLCLG